MALVIKQSKLKFFELLPLILLFFITLNGNSVIDLKRFQQDLGMILIPDKCSKQDLINSLE